MASCHGRAKLAELLIVAEGIEPEALTPIYRNKLKGKLKAAAIKAPAFGERKSHCLDDLAILTGATVIRYEMGFTLENASLGVLGSATKVVITKDSTLIVTDGNTRAAVDQRVSQLKTLGEVGAQTQVELKDKQLRVEDAVNATKAAIEEGVVVGGGCSLLRLSLKVDDIKKHLENEEQKIGAEIFRRALTYPAKLIAKNAGVNGSVVIEKVLSNVDMNYGYNAATNNYEDLMKSGIIDPAKMGARTDAKVTLGAWSWDTATGEEFRVGAGLAEPYGITWCAVEYFEASGNG